MRRILSILLWSIIAAAFIGPGTVTAAASAGASYRFALLWALAFSIVACLVLQEASARLTVVSGRTLGQALRERYPGGLLGSLTVVLVLGAVVLGCAAYEAGNILGGVAGAALAMPFSVRTLTLATVAVAWLLLWFNSPRRVALILSSLVAVMGLAFLLTAFRLAPPVAEVLRGSLVPSLPAGSELLAVALVGTTVVPYNLFLGSELARGEELGELRFGLIVAIVLGGLISMGVLIVGVSVSAPLEFAGLSEALAERLGSRARYVLAVGLLAAGLSSAVTAPLAAAVTARSILGRAEHPPSDRGGQPWSDGSWQFRGVWMAVLGAGLLVGVSGIQAVPAIILAQALNGVLLPVVAVFLFLAVTDTSLMGSRVNSRTSNFLMVGVVLVSIFLGLMNTLKALSRVVGSPQPGAASVAWLTLAIALGLGIHFYRSGRGRLPVRGKSARGSR